MKYIALILLYFSIYGNAFSQFTLSGTVKTELEVPIEGVLMNDNPAVFTNNFGNYAIENLAPGNYPIFAEKNSDHLNGVTICDAVAIQRHILGVELFDSPFKTFAADINLSNSITAFDLIIQRQMILGIETNLWPEKSWGFLKSDIVFPNPSSPFENLDYDHSVDVLDNTTLDLIGYKYGDLNNSALGFYPSTTQPDPVNLFFKPDEGTIPPQENYVVNFNAEDFTDVFGFQFTMNYDETKMEFVEMASEVLPNGLASSFHNLAPGTVTVAWHDYIETSFENGTAVFSATFNILEEIDLSQDLAINSSHTPMATMDINGCYGEVENVIPVSLSDNNDLGKLNIYPNPTFASIFIDLEMDQIAYGSIELHNVAGQSIFKKNFSEKFIFEPINLEEYRAGIYQLTVNVDNQTTTQRIIKL